MKYTSRTVLAVVFAASLAAVAMGARLQPADLTYRGAFRLPDTQGMPDNAAWRWSTWASAMAFYPNGDPSGPNDGYPGSIFGIGHDQYQYVSEIDIPAPVISAGKVLSELNRAQTLQAFADIKGGLFGALEMPRVGLTYLSAQGAQTSGKLYFAWANHLDEAATAPSHGWCDVNLSNPQSKGVWRIGDYWNYVTGDYLFPIPQAWANAYTPGQYLITGRARDGGQGARGPSLFAIGPWNEGNPPANGATLSATPLLLYQNAYDENPVGLTGYHDSDEWASGEWLVAGQNSAVIFVGTKGQGTCWYGFADGTVWPNPEGHEGEGERGFWSTSFAGQMLFYDTDELGAVALGQRASYSVQPYATLNLDSCLYNVTSTQKKAHVGAASFDSTHGFLYVFESMADADQPIVHVWSTGISSPTNPPAAPASVVATDGVFSRKVRVSWSQAANATCYEVWRNTAAVTSTAALVFSTSSYITYDDTNVTAQTVYYYWVKARNAMGASGFSVMNSGHSSGAAAQSGINDFTGDGQSDFAVFDQNTGNWFIMDVNGTIVAWAFAWGWPGAWPVSGDYNGDGIADPAVFDQNTGWWYVTTLEGGVLAWAFAWGWPGAVPVWGDYNGDGISDAAVFDDNTGRWYISAINGAAIAWDEAWGWPGAVPVHGDYDGDDTSDMAVFDSNTGAWYVRTVAGAILVWGEAWGWPGAWPVSGDYDGDGLADLAVFDNNTGAWYVRTVAGAILVWGEAWGWPGAWPVPGDYDGDGLADMAVLDTNTGAWYIRTVMGAIFIWGTAWGWPGAAPVGAM